MSQCGIIPLSIPFRNCWYETCVTAALPLRPCHYEYCITIATLSEKGYRYSSSTSEPGARSPTPSPGCRRSILLLPCCTLQTAELTCHTRDTACTVVRSATAKAGGRHTVSASPCTERTKACPRISNLTMPARRASQCENGPTFPNPWI